MILGYYDVVIGKSSFKYGFNVTNLEYINDLDKHTCTIIGDYIDSYTNGYLAFDLESTYDLNSVYLYMQAIG